MARISRDLQKRLRIEALERDTTQLELLDEIVKEWLERKTTHSKKIMNFTN